MKSVNISYWIVTVIFAAFMFFTAIPDVMMSPDAVKMISGQMGYPRYFLPFIGVAKMLGSIAILIPGYPRIKEWAYAGLFYDLFAAAYSGISVEGFSPQMLFFLIFFGFFAASYILYHKRLAASV